MMKSSSSDYTWSSDPSRAQYDEKMTVAEMLRSRGDRLADVEVYTTYEVTIRLGGKARSYRAIALHHRQVESRGKAKAEIIDEVTAGMNTVMADESARVRAPWAKYIKSSLYLAVAREIREAEKRGKGLIPADAPIGYLPGDDAVPDARNAGMQAAVVCADKSVTVSGTLGPNDGDTVNWTVTVTGGTAVSYEWTGVTYQSTGNGNDPNVTFSSTSTQTTTTNAHWYAYPDEECGAQAGSVYKIKCKVHFSDGDKKSGEALMVVNGWWDPAGTTASATISGGPRIGFDTSQNLWIVIGPGSLQRNLPTPVIYVPATSQFYNKTVTHENEHVAQWQSGVFSDFLTVGGLMAVLYPLTDATQNGLITKISNASNAWFANQQTIYNNRLPTAEKAAYYISRNSRSEIHTYQTSVE
ncbi:MAG TPA: hypothetical protein VNN73_23070 [Blastocatellia bacterium]|nr:hypothetical protein [Blastocatellia bacterium]